MHIEFYNRSCDITQDQTDSLIDAQHIAGDLIDGGFKDDVRVIIKEDDALMKNLSLEEFAKSPFYSVFGDRPVNTEIYHNLDQAEQIEVLHYVPDQLLIAEIERRLDEYRIAFDNINYVLDQMEIFKR